MTFHTLFSFGILIILYACNGQNSIHSAGKYHSSTIATGDTVPELGRSIFLIFQARNKSYWFGSNGQGVYHYDPSGAGSHTIIHYNTKDGLSNDTIREIQEDSSGNIFFTTHGGISRYDGQKFTTLSVDRSNASEWKSEPGDMWFKGEPGKNGPYRYDGKNLYHLEFPRHYMESQVNMRIPGQRYSPYEVYFIYPSGKGDIWFGTATLGICRYDGKSLGWMYEDHLQFVPGGGSFGIRSIIEDREGKFWFCNTRYRYLIDQNDSTDGRHRFIRYKKEKGLNLKAPDGNDHIYFMSVIQDEKGNLWMATYGSGVWQYDVSTGLVTHYPVREGLKTITLFSIYQDRQGGLWLGTHEAGAYRFNGKEFERFSP